MTGGWLLETGDEVYLVVAVPGGSARWVPVADVLLRVTPATETPETLLARFPGVSAVAQGGNTGVTLIHRSGRVAAIAGAHRPPAAGAVTLLHLMTHHHRPSSSRRTWAASVSASRA